ncbi:MAG: hypothetical protein CMB31_07110 [Euryarchaeota archaeon]|nr:hypothetical protein [Euryarchaeota archaeon]
MTELPDGEVIERRRGGPGVLALLMLDATRSRFDGHIRVERASNDGFLGNLGIIDGMPIMSLATDIHSSNIGGKDAMEKCLHESAMDDARISVHEGLHIPESMDLHPYSRLLSSDIQNLQEQPWWSDRRHQDLVSLGRTKSRWTSIESEFSREGAESIPFEKSRQVSVVSEGPCFAPGQSWLVDDEIPDSVLGIASNLVSLGRPLLVFSRLPPERLRSRFAIHESSSVRLTERPVNKGDIGPSLEGIMRKIEDFFFANPRAVVVIDGLEFLIGLHGFDRVYDFIRNLTDLVAESDDLLLCPIDGLAMSPQERALLQREMEMLDTHTAALWGGQGAKLAGHPFIIHAMTTIAEPRIPNEVSTPETNFSLDSEISELPEPVEDIRPDIGSLMNQWKSESTILPIEVDENEIDEFPSDEVVEEIAIQEPEDFDLPEWAIEPSSNREIEELSPSIPFDNDVEEIKQDSIVPQEVVLVTTSPRPNRPTKTTKVKRVGPKSATIDHKPKSRVRRKTPPQEHQIRTDGLREAAERWKEIVEQSNESNPFAAIPSSGKEIPEFRKIENSSVDSSADILRNSREIDGVWMPKGLEDARRHEIVHSNSRKSKNTTISRDPPSTAREFASASHKQRRDFTALKTSRIESTELPHDFYDRLALLVEKGENIGEIMSIVEKSPIEALQLLEGMEGSR